MSATRRKSEGKDSVRAMVASAKGEAYVSHAGLVEAQADPEGVVVFEGDWGGQVYAVVRASFVRCSEAQLKALLAELDVLGWREPDGAQLCFESLPVGAGVPGGMGGGVVRPEVWVHPQLPVQEAAVRSVLQGERTSVLH